MGFEIKYFYKESSEFGQYKDEILSKTSKVGKFEEDVPLEVLAGKIMSQLARRNILIVDIEIYEYAKKKINYKETDSGIIIKNKKFSFDSGAILESGLQDDEEVSRILEDEDLLNKIKNAIGIQKESKKINLAKKPTEVSKKFIRKEVYDPEIVTKHKVEQKGYKFTVGKAYPIFSEKSLIGGVINYLTNDDSGREVEVAAECFVAQSSGLLFEDDAEMQNSNFRDKEINLWRNIDTNSDVPEIRRR